MDARPVPAMASSAIRMLAAVVLIQSAASAQAQQNPTELALPAAFSSIQDLHERSVALFREAGKVIQHPRCINCHPAGDHALQGDDRHLLFRRPPGGPRTWGRPAAIAPRATTTPM